MIPTPAPRAAFRRALTCLLVAAAFPARGEPPQPEGLTPEQSQAIRADRAALAAQLQALPAAKTGEGGGHPADAQLFLKAVDWALRYEPRLAPADVDLIRRSLRRGLDRAAGLAAGRRPWETQKGSRVLGYVSAVDGSVQPYGLIVPQDYDGSKPVRLDVVLHGSVRPVGMSELRFISPLEPEDAAARPAPHVDYLELRPLGRVENGYRWAGETDVLEAIVDVSRRYRVDRDRMVLRGMSMGASGTWHLGLKHPDLFAALGPYCGYVDTHEFSHSPQPNFIAVEKLPAHQERTLHMLDSVDYAANAGVVPAVAAIGEKDPFFQAHVLMGNAMRAEGIQMVNLISPGTGHVQDPTTFAEQMRRIDALAWAGLDRAPRHLRFVTWTLKYSRCHWVEVLGLDTHYERAEIDASLAADGSVEVREPRNVARFALLPPALRGDRPQLRVGGVEISLPRGKPPPGGVVLERRGGRWRVAGPRSGWRGSGKRPGLQGPLDDAFTAPFLCVRGTGKPWNPAVGAWADAALRRFTYEWNRYFRGDLRVKDDVAVTRDDMRRFHLVLFGDPGSNRLVRECLPALPVRWSKGEVRLGDGRYPAASHAPCLVAPNPLPGGEGHYVVLNSGHTFHEKELASLNYLLFPRLGDWTVMKIGPGIPAAPSDPLPEEPVASGFFDEEWRLPTRR